MELPGKRELREQILHQMDGRTSYVSDKDVYREIDKAILRSSHGGYGTLSEKEELRRQMFYSIRGFDVLEKYLGDSSISEIMVIGASRIFVEQNGKIRRIEEHFSEEGDVYRLIEQIVAPTNRMVNEACPIVDSRLPDGSRVHIVLPPVSLEGPVITIRKFLKGGMTIEKLLAFEEFPEKLTGILSALVKSRYNILISGATNSGKSSLLNIYEYQKSQYCGLESSLEPFSQKFLQQKITEERTELQRMLTPVNTILVLANVVVFMILSFLGNTTDAEFMAAHGAMDWMDVVEKHQYYRLFTSMFLHFGADHLLQNMLILLVIGCRLERITGKLSYLLIYIGAGLIGAGTSIIFTLGNNPNTVSAGASGAIFGVMGGLLYCIISDIIQKKRHRVEEIGLMGMIFMVASALSYGFFSTGIDNAAHIGGLVGGFLITMISRFVI